MWVFCLSGASFGHVLKRYCPSFVGSSAFLRLITQRGQWMRGLCDHTGNGVLNPSTLSVVALTHLRPAQMRPGNAVCLQPSKKLVAWQGRTSLCSLWEANVNDYPATTPFNIEEVCRTENGHFSLSSSCDFFFKLCRHAKMTQNAT